ncbi:MAG TPA: DUF3108 domain-containing protein [Steroidobacteraceae bacterium]|nr:DUF3108 domain-containing protein [Steroidobacteraceae bacterium]
MNYPHRPLVAALTLLCMTAASAQTGGPGSTPGTAAAAALQPYKARYQVGYKALSGGQIEATLKRGSSPGRWIYETHAFPNVIGRIAVSPKAREHSTMELVAGGMRPLSYEFDDGSADADQDVQLRFAWSALKVSGRADGKDFTLDIKPGTQDTASVQAAMIAALLAGREPAGFPIVTGSKLRDYRYWSEGKATVTTPLGSYETVIWASQRNGSDRIAKVWHAPALGYLPVQAIQFRKGKQLVQMKLVALER